MSSTFGNAQRLNNEEMSLVPRLLTLWYSMTAPSMPSIDADFRLQEVARRGRITSLVMLVSLAQAFLPLLWESSWHIVLILLCVAMVDFLSLYLFNRRGKTILSGIIITCITEAGLLATFARYLLLHQELSLQIAPFFPALVFAIAASAPTTGPRFATCVLLFNGLLLVALQWIVPKQEAFALFLQSREGIENCFFIPLSICTGVYSTLMIWGWCTNIALRRADHAYNALRYSTSLAQRLKQQEAHIEQDVREVSILLHQYLANKANEISLAVSEENHLLPLIPLLELVLSRHEHNTRPPEQAAEAGQLLHQLFDKGNTMAWTDVQAVLGQVLATLYSTEASSNPTLPRSVSVVHALPQATTNEA